MNVAKRVLPGDDLVFREEGRASDGALQVRPTQATQDRR